MSKIWTAIKQVEREREVATERGGGRLDASPSQWDTVAAYRERSRPLSWSARLGAVLAGRRGRKVRRHA